MARTIAPSLLKERINIAIIIGVMFTIVILLGGIIPSEFQIYYTSISIGLIIIVSILLNLSLNKRSDRFDLPNNASYEGITVNSLQLVSIGFALSLGYILFWAGLGGDIFFVLSGLIFISIGFFTALGIIKSKIIIDGEGITWIPEVFIWDMPVAFIPHNKILLIKIKGRILKIYNREYPDLSWFIIQNPKEFIKVVNDHIPDKLRTVKTIP